MTKLDALPLATASRGTLAERFDGGNNSLNFLRLCLAVSVIVYHAAPIGGFDVYLHIGDISLGHLAVAGFFCVSGYLITQSRKRSTIGRYALKRALRIFPGFWACLVVTAFGIALLMSVQTGGWELRAAIAYVTSNFDMWNGAQQVGTTISGLPYPQSLNGSLWTLRFEVLCYILVAVALSIGFIKRHRLFILAAFVVLTAAGALAPHSTPQPILDFLFLTPFFLAGAVLFLYAERVTISHKLALAAAVIFVAVALLGHGGSLGGLPVAYLCMYAGIMLPKWFQKVGRDNDISYGMYLYGFPVQHLLVAFGVAGAGQAVYSLASVLATVPLAAASWFLVERPANNLAKQPKLAGKRRRSS